MEGKAFKRVERYRFIQGKSTEEVFEDQLLNNQLKGYRLEQKLQDQTFSTQSFSILNKLREITFVDLNMELKGRFQSNIFS